MASIFSSRPVVHVYAVRETIAQESEDVREVYSELEKSLESGQPFAFPSYLRHTPSVFIPTTDIKLYDDKTTPKKFVYKVISQKTFEKKFPNPSDVVSVDINDFEITTQTTQEVGRRSLGTSSPFEEAAKPAAIAKAHRAPSPSLRDRERQEQQRTTELERSFSLEVSQLDDTLRRLETYHTSNFLVRWFSFGQPGRLVKKIQHQVDDIVKRVEANQVSGSHMVKPYVQATDVLRQAQVALRIYGKATEIALSRIINVRIIVLNELVEFYRTSPRKESQEQKAERVRLLLDLNNERIQIEEAHLQTIHEGLERTKKKPKAQEKGVLAARKIQRDDLKQQLYFHASRVAPLYIKQITLIQILLKHTTDDAELKKELKELKEKLKGASEAIQKHSTATDLERRKEVLENIEECLTPKA